jgi:hypothetical protein
MGVGLKAHLLEDPFFDPERIFYLKYSYMYVGLWGGLIDKRVNQWGFSKELGSTKELYLVMYMVLQFKSEINADWDHKGLLQ